jgi:hypothetical protein
MDRISDGERRRIAGLLAEGAPVWRLHREINRSRYAIRRAVIALQRPARREPERSPLRLSLAEREEIFRGAGGGRVVAGDRPRAGACPVDGVPGGGGQRRAWPVPGLCRGPAGAAPGAPSPAGQAVPVPAAACGGGEQAGAALVAGADRGLAEGGLSR